MDRIRSGFSSYLSSGEFTPDFLADVNMIISKVYAGWSLYEDEEEFNSSCWTKIIRSLQIYDEEGQSDEFYAPRSGPLSPYLHQVIWNEAKRIHSKHKRMAFDDIDESPRTGLIWSEPKNYDDDLLVRDRVCSFARMAYKMGVYVSQKNLYRNYILRNLTPAVKAFMWSYILSLKSGS